MSCAEQLEDLRRTYLDLADAILPRSEGPQDLIAEVRRLRAALADHGRDELGRLRRLEAALLDHGGWDRRTSPGARLMACIDEARAARCGCVRCERVLIEDARSNVLVCPCSVERFDQLERLEAAAIAFHEPGLDVEAFVTAMDAYDAAIDEARAARSKP